jgi:hypothetical protein
MNANSNGLLQGTGKYDHFAATCVQDEIVERKLHGVSGLRVRKRSGQIMNFVDHYESVIERVDRTVLRQLIQPNFSKAIVADDSIPFFDELSKP